MAVSPGVYCSLHIGRAVADVEGRFLIAAQLVQQLQHACRIRLARDIRAFAIVMLTKSTEIVLNHAFAAESYLFDSTPTVTPLLLDAFPEH